MNNEESGRECGNLGGEGRKAQRRSEELHYLISFLPIIVNFGLIHGYFIEKLWGFSRFIGSVLIYLQSSVFV